MSQQAVKSGGKCAEALTSDGSGSRHQAKEGCCSHHHDHPAENGECKADAAAAEEHRAILMAAQMISIAAKVTLAEAHSMLHKHIVQQGDLFAAAQFACQELMDGPRRARPTPKLNDTPDDTGVSLAVRQLGKSAPTPTVRELAKRFKLNNPDEDRRPTLDEDRRLKTGDHGKTDRKESPPRPQRLFDAAFEAHARSAGGGLTAGQRLATAMRRADGDLWRQARDERFSTAPAAFNDGDGNTPCSAALLANQTMGTMATAATARAQPAIQRAAAQHSSPGVRIAEQMRLKREQQATASQQGQGTIVVVNSTGNKLPTWKPGSEAEGKGFNWRTKQKMVHAWEQYQLSEGLHAPKTFKSMIDPDLIPLICSECSLEEGDWEVLDDVALLSAIEDTLRPHDAMDFTVQLKRITFDNDESKGTLTQRYRLFAEAFLAKVSEAKAAGCALQENVVKLTFLGRFPRTRSCKGGWSNKMGVRG